MRVMEVRIFGTKGEMGAAAAAAGADRIREALAGGGEARIVMASAASQFEVVEALTVAPGIAWERVTLFHLDEYIGLSSTHPASFSKFLRDRFIAKLPRGLKGFHAIEGEREAAVECARIGELLAERAPEVAFIGVGENGHIAFNDPPADFETKAPYLVVKLDEICRQQQVGEGWFPNLEAVPTHAMSMSVHQIMKAGRIVCTVPDERKAAAVQKAVGEMVSPEVPATILQEHNDCLLFLDETAASRLPR
jgi:glucosamine-6-phosphate deaminase